MIPLSVVDHHQSPAMMSHFPQRKSTMEYALNTELNQKTQSTPFFFLFIFIQGVKTQEFISVKTMRFLLTAGMLDTVTTVTASKETAMVVIRRECIFHD